MPIDSNGKLAHRVFSGIAWTLFLKVVGVLSVLLVNALLARMLSTEELGAYFVITSIVMFGAILARLGLRQAVVRLVAEAVAENLPGKIRSLLGIVFGVIVVGIILVIALLTIPAATGNQYSKDLKKIIALSVAFGTFFVISGLLISYILNIASGATIVLIAGATFLLSIKISEKIKIVGV